MTLHITLRLSSLHTALYTAVTVSRRAYNNERYSLIWLGIILANHILISQCLSYTSLLATDLGLGNVLGPWEVHQSHTLCSPRLQDCPQHSQVLHGGPGAPQLHPGLICQQAVV